MQLGLAQAAPARPYMTQTDQASMQSQVLWAAARQAEGGWTYRLCVQGVHGRVLGLPVIGPL